MPEKDITIEQGVRWVSLSRVNEDSTQKNKWQSMKLCLKDISNGKKKQKKTYFGEILSCHKSKLGAKFWSEKIKFLAMSER